MNICALLDSPIQVVYEMAMAKSYVKKFPFDQDTAYMLRHSEFFSGFKSWLSFFTLLFISPLMLNMW